MAPPPGWEVLSRHRTLRAAAKRYAQEYGYYGKIGGYIYDKDDEPIVQGWDEFGAWLVRSGEVRIDNNYAIGGRWLVRDRGE